MRICYDARSIRVAMTGVGVYSAHLLQAMQAERDGHDWILTHLPDAPLDQYARRTDTRLIETRSDYGDHPAGDIWLNHGLRRILKETQADLIHGPAFLVPWLRTRARKIVTIHDLVCFRIPGAYTPRFAWYMRQVIRLSTRAADGVIAVSESTANDLVTLVGVPRGKIRVIHEAAGPDFKEPPDEQARAVRSRYRLHSPYLLYVGTIEPRKGVPRMIAILERLDARGIELSLALAGSEGWRSEAIVRAIERSALRQRIHRLGYVPAPDLPSLYKGAEALLYLSDYEGFGLPPLEAMTCGCPVVAARRASLPEVVGDGGVLVDPDDDATISETIIQWRSSPERRREMIEKGRRRAAQFSWRRAARETLDYYREVVSGQF